ncbi:hypothetical protein BJY52DRAFT_1186996 [Lactarius psammicola]|nr:hypothetical protein BJY52DRAFT_1186996 [Lactarius psammicola]
MVTFLRIVALLSLLNTQARAARADVARVFDSQELVLLIKRLVGWYTRLADGLNIVTFARRRNEAVTAAVVGSEAARDSCGGMQRSLDHAMYVSTCLLVLRTCHERPVTHTTLLQRPCPPSWNDSILLLRKMLDAALDKRPKQPVFADTIGAEIDTATQVRVEAPASPPHQPAVGQEERRDTSLTLPHST